MTDDEKAALRYLRSIDAKLDALLAAVDRMSERFAALEERVARLRRDFGHEDAVDSGTAEADKNPGRPH